MTEAAYLVEGLEAREEVGEDAGDVQRAVAVVEGHGPKVDASCLPQVLHGVQKGF